MGHYITSILREYGVKPVFAWGNLPLEHEKFLLAFLPYDKHSRRYVPPSGRILDIPHLTPDADSRTLRRRGDF
jgi:hypothetical protein